MASSFFWLSATLFCLLLQASFSMIEMAALSFNRVRLHYLVHQKVKRAIWLQHMLSKPYRLFGTAMLGVNCALQLGSQSAREFYSALHLDPDLAPLTQIFLVVIFAELAPLLAARRCSEHVIMLYTPFIYVIYRLCSPFIWFISLCVNSLSSLLGYTNKRQSLDLSREELQKLLEMYDEENDTFHLVLSHLFTLRHELVSCAMHRLSDLTLLPRTATVAQARHHLQGKSQTFVPLYDKKIHAIIAIVSLESLASAHDRECLHRYSKRPCLLSTKTTLTAAMETLSAQEQSYALITGEHGKILGVLFLGSILKRLFSHQNPHSLSPKKALSPLIERSVAGNMRIADFNREYGTHLPDQGLQTLAQLMVTHLEAPAGQGDQITIGSLALEAQETGLTGIKTIRITSA